MKYIVHLPEKHSLEEIQYASIYLDHSKFRVIAIFLDFRIKLLLRSFLYFSSFINKGFWVKSLFIPKSDTFSLKIFIITYYHRPLTDVEKKEGWGYFQLGTPLNWAQHMPRGWTVSVWPGSLSICIDRVLPDSDPLSPGSLSSYFISTLSTHKVFARNTWLFFLFSFWCFGYNLKK